MKERFELCRDLEKSLGSIHERTVKVLRKREKEREKRGRKKGRKETKSKYLTLFDVVERAHLIRSSSRFVVPLPRLEPVLRKGIHC